MESEKRHPCPRCACADDAARRLSPAGETRARRARFRQGELARLVSVPQNTMSSHLNVLSRAGLVTAERQSRSIIYRANLSAFQTLLVSFLVQDCCGGRPELCGPLLDVLQPCCPPKAQNACPMNHRQRPVSLHRQFGALDPRGIYPARRMAGIAFLRVFRRQHSPAGGSTPAPPTLLESLEYPTEGLRSKSWQEFAEPGAPVMDFVFTVCDNAAGEACPIWPGQPMTAHWGIEDPAAIMGTDIEREAAFVTAFRYLKNRVSPVHGVAACRDRYIGASHQAAGISARVRAQPRPGRRWRHEHLRAVSDVMGCASASSRASRLAMSCRRCSQPSPAQRSARVNIPVAVLIWLMIIPMLLKIDFGALGKIRQHWRGVGVTLFINWAVKPFSMALLGTVFIGHVFAPMLPAAQVPSYIAGLILLAAAPLHGHGVCVVQSLRRRTELHPQPGCALNDVLMVFLFAPLVGVLLGVASIDGAVGGAAAVGSALYRRAGCHRAGLAALPAGKPGRAPSIAARSPACSLSRWWRCWRHWCCCSHSRADRFFAQPIVIAILAVPILIQVYLNAGLGLLAQPAFRRGLVRGRAGRADRRQQLFRTGGCGGHKPVWPQLGCGAGNRRRRIGRGAGDAVGRQDREGVTWMVRGPGTPGGAEGLATAFDIGRLRRNAKSMKVGTVARSLDHAALDDPAMTQRPGKTAGRFVVDRVCR